MSVTGLVFLMAFATGLGLSLLRHPIYGLYTYIGVFYLHPPSRWWGDFLPEFRWSLLAALVTLVSILRLPKSPNQPSWLSSGAAKILLSLVVLMWVQFAWALDGTFHEEGVTLFTKYLILFYLIVRLADTPERITGIILAHVIGCFYFGYLATFSDSGGRLEGVGGPGVDDANTMAMHVGTGLVCAGLLFLGAEKRVRIACFLALPFMLNTMILAGSRGAFLGLLASGITAFILKPPEFRRAFIGYAFVGVLLFAYLAHDIFWERMGTITAAVDETQEIDSSAESRLVLFGAQWEMFKDHPFGAGYRGTTVLSRDYLDVQWLTSNEGPVEEVGTRSSHNSFMTTLVDQGVFGAVIFIALAFWIYRTLRALKRVKGNYDPMLGLHRAAVGGALAVVFTAGIFTSYWKAEVQIWLIALLVAIHNCVDQYQTAGRTAEETQRSPADRRSTAAAARSHRASGTRHALK